MNTNDDTVESMSGSSTSFSTAREEISEEEKETASLIDSFWKTWNSVSFAMFRSSTHSDDVSTIVERRDCSSMDTTPNNDLKQFLAAVKVMTGSTQIQPWNNNTSYTEIPICRQLETWDCGALLTCFLNSIL